MRRTLIVVALAASALTLTGCSASGSSTASSGSGSEAIAPAPHAGNFGDSKVATGVSGSTTAITSSSVVVQRQVEIKGTEVIRTAHPIAVGDKIAQIVTDAGGRVDDRTQTAATKTATATSSLTLRIPETKLTGTLAKLKKLGSVESIRLSSVDVTTKSEDLNARITALRTSIGRLLTLEKRAKSTSSLLEIEDDLSERQGELESLTAQQRYLSDQVAMSTVDLRLIAPKAVIAAKTPSAGNAFFAGWAGFGTFFTWVFLVLSYLVPWLLLAAVIAVAAVVTVRVRRRRAAAKAPGTPVATA
jgi:hypothetical protein